MGIRAYISEGASEHLMVLKYIKTLQGLMVMLLRETSNVKKTSDQKAVLKHQMEALLRGKADFSQPKNQKILFQNLSKQLTEDDGTFKYLAKQVAGLYNKMAGKVHSTLNSFKPWSGKISTGHVNKGMAAMALATAVITVGLIVKKRLKAIENLKNLKRIIQTDVIPTFIYMSNAIIEGNIKSERDILRDTNTLTINVLKKNFKMPEDETASRDYIS
jgi:hypothetical protein